MTSHEARQLPLEETDTPNPETIPTKIRRVLTPSTGYKLEQDAVKLAKQDKNAPSTTTARLSKLQTLAVTNSMQFQNLQTGRIMDWDKLFIVRVQSRPKPQIIALVPLYDLFNLFFLLLPSPLKHRSRHST